MQTFPGSFPLIQLMTLKTQLYVDVERLPTLEDREAFRQSWDEHLSSIEYLLQAYRKLEQPETE